MQLACPRCHRVLEYATEAPSFCSYCGCALAPTQAELPASEATTLPPREPGAPEAGDVPEQVGGYRLLRPLGAGGMGSVYEAEEAATGRRVALKLISPDYAGSATTLERFRQEGRLASSVIHPRCVFVLAADEEVGRPYIVMELMPGETLEHLVEKRGPLPVEEAVATILDVIDGLREAHRLGLVHRDVKPSNCFLEADGRVKVGDFGLAKSLVQKAHLTRTGTFMGTLLYAAPEQIRGEAVDQQSDLYSVAATLYYLLAGQAPFQTGDAAATLARIVADPVPPLRARRPDVPPGLEQVILRGLERDRPRRWRNLDEFRAALLPFLPGRLSVGGVGLRFGAYLLDCLFIFWPLGMAQGAVAMWTLGHHASLVPLRVSTITLMVVFFVYFAVLEGIWGCSLGKWLLRLRVWGARQSGPPGMRRALLRSAVWFVLILLPAQINNLLLDPQAVAQDPGKAIFLSGLQFGLLAVGLALMLCTMRARNGFRCLHDILSGTRVVQLPEREKQRSLPGRRLDADLLPAAGVPDRLGAFAVRGVLGRGADTQVLLGEDPGLRRAVLLWLRSADAPPLTEARRQVSRPARLRWLAGGRHDDFQWDAFLAPSGSPVTEVVSARGRLPWADACPLLEQLSDELAEAEADGTLPPTLTVDQVWVGTNGQVVLLDAPLVGSAGDHATAGEAPLALLGRTAVVLLEGKERATDAPPGSIHAPLPLYASALLARLLGGGPEFKDVRQFRAALRAARGKPAEVTRPRRAAHLLVQTVFLGLGLACMVTAGITPAMIFTGFDIGEAQSLKYGREEMREGSYREFVARSVSPSPAALLGALTQLDADLHMDERFQDRQRVAAARHEARRRAVSPPLGQYLALCEEQSRGQVQGMMDQQRKSQAATSAFAFRWKAANLTGDKSVFQLESGVTGFFILFLAFWPAVWVLWAFVARGGLSFRLMGLALVRGDGRRAARLRCAWRALLVWGPVTALLLGSLVLDGWYWDTWDVTEPHRWAAWLAMAAWWGGWALLLAYVIVALRNPVRGPHDRLAGTYLVPR